MASAPPTAGRPQAGRPEAVRVDRRWLTAVRLDGLLQTPNIGRQRAELANEEIAVRRIWRHKCTGPRKGRDSDARSASSGEAAARTRSGRWVGKIPMCQCGGWWRDSGFDSPPCACARGSEKRSEANARRCRRNACGRAAGIRPEGEAHIKPDPPGAAHWRGAKRRMRRSRIGWAAAHARRGRRAGAGLSDQASRAACCYALKAGNSSLQGFLKAGAEQIRPK